MKIITKRFLYWTPRIITILFTLILSIFSLDVVIERRTLWEVIQAILINQIPVGLMIISLIVAWRQERTGAFIFIGLALVSVFFDLGQFQMIPDFLIAALLLIIGILFWLNWIYKDVIAEKEIKEITEDSDLKKLKLSLHLQAMSNTVIWAASMIAMVILMHKAPIVKKLYPILAGGTVVGISLINTISKIKLPDE